MSDLADRYGATPPRQRWLVGGVGGAVAVALLAVVAWSVLDRSTPQVRSQLVRYDVVSAQLATADLTVVRADSSVSATCRLEALAGDHSVVGEIVRTVDSGPTTQTLRLELRTVREAVTVARQGCTAPDQPRPS